MKQKTPTLPASIDRREFGTSRKGYDKREVKEFLRELESNFRELERWAQDTKTRLQKAEFEAEKSRSSEGQSVDSAMVAVFDAKDRVLSRARKQAAKIEAEARDRAASLEHEARIHAEEAGLQVDQDGVVEDAQQRAGEIISAAEGEAERIRNDQDAEAERLITEFEDDRQRLTAEVERLAAALEELETQDDDVRVEADKVAAGLVAAAQQAAGEVVAEAEAKSRELEERAFELDERGRILEAERGTMLAEVERARSERESEASQTLDDARAQAQEIIAAAMSSETSATTEIERSEVDEAGRLAAEQEAARVLDLAHAEAEELVRKAEREAQKATESRRELESRITVLDSVLSNGQRILRRLRANAPRRSPTGPKPGRSVFGKPRRRPEIRQTRIGSRPQERSPQLSAKRESSLETPRSACNRSLPGSMSAVRNFARRLIRMPLA